MDSDKSFTYVVKTNGSTKINPRNVNIDGSEDPFYRYQMRQLYVQVLGKGKMIKTALLNIDDVSKDLKVNPSHLTHFMGYEFEAVAKYDAKKSNREKGSIAGDREAVDLSSVIRKFINDVVLCPKCRLPETNLIIEKSGDITLSCRGCGEKSSITDKLKPKFKAFLQKNVMAEKEKERGKEKEKEKEREEKEKVKEKEAVAPKVAKKEKKKKSTEEDEDEGDWAVDTSAEAARKRRHELIPENNLAAIVKVNPIEELKQSIEENPDGDVADMILKLKEKNKIPESKLAALVFEIFFSDGGRPDVAKHEDVLKKVITTEAAQMGLIDCLEKLCRDEELSKSSAHILKDFYDLDLAEEEVILKWYGKKNNKAKKFRTEIEPFVNWLQSAEEESE